MYRILEDEGKWKTLHLLPNQEPEYLEDYMDGREVIFILGEASNEY